MMLKRLLVLLVVPGLCLQVLATSLEVGEKLPVITIDRPGECFVEAGKAGFRPWGTDQLDSEITVLEYTPARAGVDKVNAALFAALEQAGYPPAQLSIVRLVNSSDALWGTSGMVAGEVKKHKLADPLQNYIVDARGVGLQRWAFKKKKTYLVIIDSSGTVLATSEGRMNDEQLEATLALIHSRLKI